MNIEFLSDALLSLQTMKKDLASMDKQVDNTWSIDVFTLNNLREEAKIIQKKAIFLNKQIYETSTSLGMRKTKVQKYLNNIIPLAQEVGNQATEIIKKINAKDVLSKAFAPVGKLLSNVSKQMSNLLSRLRDKLPASVRRKLLPS